jgi:hypothetical protein
MLHFIPPIRTHVAPRLLSIAAWLKRLAESLLPSDAVEPENDSAQGATHAEPASNGLSPADPYFRTVKWPQIGGPNFVAPPHGVFLSEAYRKRFVPGETITVYIAQCPGQKKVANVLGVPLAKVSTCGPGRLAGRIATLNRDAYGAVCDHPVKGVMEPGWNDWKTIAPRTKAARRPGSPVEVLTDCFTVTLPSSMPRTKFEPAFDALVAEASISAWMATQKGKEYAAARGVPWRIGARATNYLRGGVLSVETAREIVVLRFHGDQDRLVALIERVILDHLGVS